jgi:hypothetical protein
LTWQNHRNEKNSAPDVNQYRHFHRRNFIGLRSYRDKRSPGATDVAGGTDAAHHTALKKLPTDL